jgi:hypothetical protein
MFLILNGGGCHPCPLGNIVVMEACSHVMGSKHFFSISQAVHCIDNARVLVCTFYEQWSLIS